MAGVPIRKRLMIVSNDIGVGRLVYCEIMGVDLRRAHLHRSLINYIALAAFHSHIGTRLFYDSPVSNPLHRVLYAIRSNRLIGRLLYGSSGPPTVEGRRS